MPASPSEWILVLAVPVIVCGSALAATVEYWWGRRTRRRGIRPADVPSVYVPRQELEARLAARAEREQHAIQSAERLVLAELARVQDLYEPPTISPSPTR